MVGNLLLRGMMIGVLAGLLAFGFAKIFGEPWVEYAIAFEDHMSHAAAASDEAGEPEIVSRATQAGAGLFTGLVVYGAAVGGLFALAFAFANGRLGSFSPRSTAALLAALGFVAIVLVPQLKYPANPPAVGSAETIGARTELFFAMLAFSVALMAASVMLARRVAERLGGWNGATTGAFVYLAVVAVMFAALPSIEEIPASFSPAALWNFRVASIGAQAVLWSVIGLGFGAVTEHAARRARPAARAAGAAGWR
ncbi:CbtA family protein [Hansschlegelia sp.]|uniref:CbtA family protein n=1 Tax=Hansschlegelia sp. TaxID=2041892 RepID=UPI002BE39844|nr:CbtA family protein [Hansschlegelia sp.]HVI27052.1 CbtA family protein [Hansschlegelia sp.]